VRYRVFDIETVIHKTVIWFCTSSIVAIPIFFAYQKLFPHIKESVLYHTIFWVGSFLILVFYLRSIQPEIDHFFKRRQSNLENISGSFTEDLVHLKGLQQLIQRIEKTISDTLYPQWTEIFIVNETSGTYRLSNTTRNTAEGVELVAEPVFLQWLVQYNKVAYSEFIDIDPAYAAVKDTARKYFNQTNAPVVMPLALNERLLGVINLGKKSSLKRYTGIEFRFLTALKNQSTIAISNSLLYETMEEQVRQRTKELMEVQRQLIQAEKMATVGTLAGGVAHEINNPLTAILTNAQMLLASDTIDDKLDRESLELIEEATKRCRTIVQKLMAYARKPLETTTVSRINVADALKSVTAFIGYQLEQDNIRIDVNMDRPAYFVIGNQNELEQVFTNLVLNGRDAIKQVKKGGAITINISRVPHASWVKIDVRDEGLGIPKDIAAKIFDPFFTTKEVGRGVGLGLSICQAIIEKHKGTINFKSEEGRGAIFTVLLPSADKETVHV
jgi:signal transduction histidine kinase